MESRSCSRLRVTFVYRSITASKPNAVSIYCRSRTNPAPFFVRDDDSTARSKGKRPCENPCIINNHAQSAYRRDSPSKLQHRNVKQRWESLSDSPITGWLVEQASTQVRHS